MRESAEYKRIALEALRGKWKLAVLTGFIAALLGGSAIGGGFGSSTGEDLAELLRESSAWPQIRPFVTAALIALLLLGLVQLVLGGATQLGYATFNLNLTDGRPVSLRDLFCHYDRLGTGFVMSFLSGLYLFLWSLLLLIPGIVKSYSYAMAPYILAENPGMSANESITASRRMMDGHKWQLFDLHLHFLGWALLCALPAVLGVFFVLGPARTNYSALPWLIPFALPTFIGMLFLRPYQEAAQAAFYRELAAGQTLPMDALTRELDR